MKLTINDQSGVIRIDGKARGYHEDGQLYWYNADGFSEHAVEFQDRRELERLIEERVKRDARVLD